MSGLDVTTRAATRDDAADLARLIDLAGEGLPRMLWSRMAEPGEDIWDVGARRAARDEGGFSWRNARIAEVGGQIAGAIVTYRVGPPEPVDDLQLEVQSLQALENLVPGTRYVNVLATYAPFRGRGIGSRLLAEVEDGDMSIIVADRNETAHRLYLSLGYVEQARAPLKGDWGCESREWVLLTKPAGLAKRRETA
jgi:ribosomal protein S18 acetylase RimI-like enzyme